MPIAVTDARSHSNDQIAHAANALKRSDKLRKVFDAISSGGKNAKTVSRLMDATGFTRVAILQLGGQLADRQLVHKVKIDGETAYEKDRFLSSHRQKILRLAQSPKALSKLPTKYSGTREVTIKMARVKSFKPQQITCDDFTQFSKIRSVKKAEPRKISEAAFKRGIQTLIGEKGKFQDWGGEKNDLFSSRLVFKGRRRAVAFAFKGPGTQGKLTPAKLGKNGDQIQRLFQAPAEIFVVQYHAQVGEEVYGQMKTFATVKSLHDGRPIWYSVIDGSDTSRLLRAYPKVFV